MALDTDAAELVTDAPYVAHVATTTADEPRVSPVWYAYDPERGVLEFLGKGQKVADLRENPKVALSVRNPEEQWHVSIRGTATVIEDVAEINDATRRIFPEYLDGDDPEEWGVSGEKLSFDPDDVLVRVEVRTLTARDSR
ncbi:pyridoxamine 5'-phosphate oxidase family protein [Halosegnis rubeus]|uniref:Pyridoxamine 5'-phosphate oxidase family protein n=1 Tax=Halosegnis rubeus TaxID=2212850 RepID=A0A5N5UE87_9EURY|nr:pyridoxamine 5'-phosphate oxidase family protein [Halosegnis rubeus]KAB7515742.1 pyridoxamine 5'-phosphate oxidase family protein [Halosegnis rubeus]